MKHSHSQACAVTVRTKSRKSFGLHQMLRISKLATCRGTVTNITTAKQSHVTSSAKAAADLSSETKSPPEDSISRYIPTETRAFLVEDHRLNSTERTSQKVASIIPWALFGFLVVSPFFVMRYNLEKLSIASANTPVEMQTKHNLTRPAFRKVSFSEMPEILARRFPSFVFGYDSSFHSQVLYALMRDLDGILSAHGVEISVCAMDLATADSKFRSQYPVGPIGQLVVPKDGSVVDFSGAWSARSVVEFLIPSSRISSAMNNDLVRLETRMDGIKRCLFRERFVDKDRGSIPVDLDSILARCVDS